MHDRPLRQSFVEVLQQANGEATRAFARCILEPRGNRRACWGTLAEEAAHLFARTEDALELWRALMLVGDARALLVFLDLFRERIEVLREVVESLPLLPATVQCAVVSMPEVEALLSPALDLHPAARELLAASPSTRRKEHALHTARMRALRALRAGSLLSPDVPSRPEEALCLPGDPP
jgi:hypothetical protein